MSPERVCVSRSECLQIKVSLDWGFFSVRNPTAKGFQNGMLVGQDLKINPAKIESTCLIIKAYYASTYSHVSKARFLPIRQFISNFRREKSMNSTLLAQYNVRPYPSYIPLLCHSSVVLKPLDIFSTWSLIHVSNISDFLWIAFSPEVQVWYLFRDSHFRGSYGTCTISWKRRPYLLTSDFSTTDIERLDSQPLLQANHPLFYEGAQTRNPIYGQCSTSVVFSYMLTASLFSPLEWKKWTPSRDRPLRAGWDCIDNVLSDECTDLFF